MALLENGLDPKLMSIVSPEFLTALSNQQAHHDGCLGPVLILKHHRSGLAPKTAAPMRWNSWNHAHSHPCEGTCPCCLCSFGFCRSSILRYSWEKIGFGCALTLEIAVFCCWWACRFPPLLDRMGRQRGVQPSQSCLMDSVGALHFCRAILLYCFDYIFDDFFWN